MNNLSNAFPRESRLLTPSNYSFVFEDAIPAVSPHITVLARFNTINGPRLGITVPKKKVRNAVDRNKIKRIVRESFRIQRHQLPNVDIIVIAKHGIGQMDKKSLARQLDKLWLKMSKRCEQQTQKK
ncbi:ribonuclease P protein component [Glaciecola sp. MH2013]|uniref:ribonuclease P protein component n=1 Tax=Glaciecola sp. MH2013 TaxID=2785524 RepID=UPI00189EDE88|nr:ribonuclease P protein component [Glaciecola sp. MH2013]MBF7074654.1 ribonuclease P protein component [Glaciecola sp. MH2013]